MQSRVFDMEGRSNGNLRGDEEVTSAAQAAIAALAHGVAPLADLAFPWPPPSYVWPRRTAEDILTHVKQRKRRKCSAHSRVLSLGSRALDEKLSRYFSLGSLVEIVGEAGTGKTQLALTLAAETIIQCCDMHKFCSHTCASCPGSLKISDVARKASEEATTLTQAHTQASYCQITNSQHVVRDVNGPSECLCKPAVVYYLHTEGAFPVERLQEIVLHRQRRRDEGAGKPEFQYSFGSRERLVHAVDNHADMHTKLLLERVFTEEISSEEQLWSNLTRRLPRLTIYHRVALVVLDSVAAIFRPTVLENVSSEGICDCSSTALVIKQRKANVLNQLKGGLIDRASKLLRVGALLRRLCTEHDFCCVVINQVSDAIKEQLLCSPSQLGYDVSAVRVDGTLLPPEDGREAQPVVLRKNRTKERLASFNSGNNLCSMDGKYIWHSRSAHGPVLENFKTQPALGFTWGNALNCRLMLHKVRDRDSSFVKFSSVGKIRTPLRCCYAVFGSDADVSEDVHFKVNVSGVEEP